MASILKKLSHQVLVTISAGLVRKFQSRYRHARGEELPIILVAGTVGKSSQTIILNQGLEHLGFRVWSGTSLNKNFNTLSGLIMTLGEFKMSIESVGVVGKFSFVMQSLLIWWTKEWRFGNKPHVLVFEVAVDLQNEMAEFVHIFKKGVDTVVITALSSEHLGGFSNIFDTDSWTRLQSHLPANYLNLHGYPLETNPNLSSAEKNVYLEQLKLLPLTRTYLIPADNDLSNPTLIQKVEGPSTGGSQKTFQLSVIDKPLITRESSGALNVNKLRLPGKYLLPPSFARQIVASETVLGQFGIQSSSLQEVLENLELPNGRFGFFEGLHGTKIVDGSYNNDPASLTAFLNLLLEVHASGVNYLVVGEMRELGLNAQVEHQQAVNRLEELSQQYGTQVILIGQEWNQCNYNRQILKTYSKVGQIIYYFQQLSIPAEAWIWVKGSQNTIFLEALVESLLINPHDIHRLARRGPNWDELRAPYIQP